MYRQLLLAATAAALFSCAEPVDTSVAEDEQQMVHLTKSDSIGLDLGDSNLILGAVEGVVTGPDGNIAVLDRAACCIKVFSPDGSFIRQISREGYGPGELVSNAFLTITENGTLLVTGDGGEVLGIHSFDYYTGDWIASEQSFGSPPTCLEGAAGGTYMRKNISLDTSTGEPMVAVAITLNEIGQEEPLVTFMEDLLPFDMEDMAAMVSLVWFGYDLACDYQGHFYIAPRSSESAEVYAFDSLGNELFSIELDLEPVLRNEEELETEMLVLRSKAAAMGDGIPVLEPDPYKPMIRGLEVDEDGNLWVLLGGPVQPEFRVFNPSGEQIFNADIEGEQPDGASWIFSFKGGRMTAWAEEPSEGFQKVWILQ